MAHQVRHVSEEEARKVAEASRETEWKQPSFLKELFLGKLRLDLVHPYPLVAEERPEFVAFYNAFREFLTREVDPVAIDATGEYPAHVVDGHRTPPVEGVAMHQSALQRDTALFGDSTAALAGVDLFDVVRTIIEDDFEAQSVPAARKQQQERQRERATKHAWTSSSEAQSAFFRPGRCAVRRTVVRLRR